jgi:hypothetical protein
MTPQEIRDFVMYLAAEIPQIRVVDEVSEIDEHKDIVVTVETKEKECLGVRGHFGIQRAPEVCYAMAHPQSLIGIYETANVRRDVRPTREAPIRDIGTMLAYLTKVTPKVSIAIFYKRPD